MSVVGRGPERHPADVNLTITDRTSGLSERFGGLTTPASRARAIDKVLNDPDTGSKLVAAPLNRHDVFTLRGLIDEKPVPYPMILQKKVANDRG